MAHSFKPRASDLHWKSVVSGYSMEDRENITVEMLGRGKVWHVEQMIDSGVSVDMNGCCFETEGHFNESLLHMAVNLRNHDMAEMLLRKGADTEEVNENCALPLVLAVTGDDEKMVRMLVIAGADPHNPMDEMGSPMEEAHRLNPRMVKIMQDVMPLSKKPSAGPRRRY